MGKRRRTGPRNDLSRRDRAKRTDLTDRPMKALGGAARLMEEYGALIGEGERLKLRLALLRLCRPKPGRERLYARILQRYEEEIEEMPRRVSALHARMERAGIRI